MTKHHVFPPFYTLFHKWSLWNSPTCVRVGATLLQHWGDERSPTKRLLSCYVADRDASFVSGMININQLLFCFSFSCILTKFFVALVYPAALFLGSRSHVLRGLPVSARLWRHWVVHRCIRSKTVFSYIYVASKHDTLKFAIHSLNDM